MATIDDQIKELQTRLNALQEREPEGGVRVVFPPRERKITKFRGDSQDEDYTLTDFYSEVTAVWEARGDLSNAGKASILISNLDGPAREEVKCLDQDEQRNPEKIKAALTAAFGEKLSIPQLMSKFYSQKQGNRESLQEYSLALKMLSRRVKAAGGDASPVIRDVFVENLRDRFLRRELKQKIRDQKDLTFEQALSWARNWEADSGNDVPKHSAGVSQQETKTGPSDIEPSLKLQLEEQRKALAELTAAIQELSSSRHEKRKPRAGIPRRAGWTPDGQVICYACGKPGHIAKECQARPPKNRKVSKQDNVASRARGPAKTDRSEN